MALFTQFSFIGAGICSLCWRGDELVDWVGGGSAFVLDGTERYASVYDTYRFDAATASPDGRFAVIYERLGTKGLLLDKGKRLGAGLLVPCRLVCYPSMALCADQALMMLSINNTHTEVNSPDQLREALAPFAGEEFREIWLSVADGPAVCALINRDLGWLMYLRQSGDAGLALEIHRSSALMARSSPTA